MKQWILPGELLHVPLFYKGFTTGTFYLQNLQWGGVILQNNFIRTNALMIMAIWLKHYTTLPLLSDSSQLEVMSRWTFVCEYYFFKSTIQTALFLWSTNQKALLLGSTNQKALLCNQQIRKLYFCNQPIWKLYFCNQPIRKLYFCNQPIRKLYFCNQLIRKLYFCYVIIKMHEGAVKIFTAAFSLADHEFILI